MQRDKYDGAINFFRWLDGNGHGRRLLIETDGNVDIMYRLQDKDVSEDIFEKYAAGEKVELPKDEKSDDYYDEEEEDN